MKRIDRNPERFGVIELFEPIARKQGLKLNDPSSLKSFMAGVSESLEKSRSNPILLHGRRTESMFEHVAAGLGRAILIKREDSGEICAVDTNLQPPDFRIVLDDGKEVFIEVKNCHEVDLNHRLSLKKSYLSSLKGYASIFKCDLYIAIFWSRWRKWTLVLPENFTPSERPSISFVEAAKKDQMSLLGDIMVGTTPPLSLRFSADPNKPRNINEKGECEFTIGHVDLYCNGIRIDDPVEKKLAFYFMRNSDWRIGEPKAKIEGKQLAYIDYISQPEEAVPNQGFQMLGSLSEMISRSYNTLTTESGEIHQLSPTSEPGSLGVVIPDGYKGKQLPLWRFTLKPKEE